MKYTLTVLLALGLAGSLGCGRGKPNVPAAPPPPTPMPPPEQLYYDNGGGIRDSTRMVIRDAATFSAQWARATASQSSPPPIPNIDFNRQMVILVASGQKTPEDQIHVDSLLVRPETKPDGSREETLTIVVRNVVACRTLRTQAFPLEFVSARRFTGPVKFLEKRDSGNCRDHDRP
jgi:hypothetical protein